MNGSRLSNRVPLLYLEKTSLKVKDGSILRGEDAIPFAQVGALLLGPGTTVSQQAMKELSGAGVLVFWVGEEGAFLYSAGQPLCARPQKIIEQAYSYKVRRDKVARKMFKLRFGVVDNTASSASLMGMEGQRVKQLYKDLSAKHGISWPGRNSVSPLDPLNRSISGANAHLHAAANIAVLASGYSPAIGFVHDGFEKAFSCDIADIIKFDTSVPLAFRVAAEDPLDLKTEIRHGMRDLIRKEGLIEKMMSLCDAVFS